MFIAKDLINFFFRNLDSGINKSFKSLSTRDALSHLSGNAMSSQNRKIPKSWFGSRESQSDNVVKPVTGMWEQRRMERQSRASTADYLPEKKSINAALLYLGSVSLLLLFAALLLSADPCNERGSFLKSHQPLPSWQSISTASRGKIEFARFFPQGADVSLSPATDYNGNTIKPQVYSYVERALFSRVPEDLTTANVLTATMTSVKNCFYPCSQIEVQFHRYTPYQTPYQIRSSCLYAFQGSCIYRFAENLLGYHLQGKKQSLKPSLHSSSSFPGDSLSHVQDLKGD